MAHDEFSPSKRHQFKHCPGSVREQAKYPEKSSGLSAIDGTHSHTLLETCIKKGLISAQTLIGETLEDHEGVFKVDVDRADRVDVAIEYIKGRLQILEKPTVISESRVNPERLIGHDDASGTVDVQIRSKFILELIDYKDGMMPTDAREQLEQYAVGVLAELEEHKIKTIVLTVVQPKLQYKGLDPISSIELPVETVLNDVAKSLADEITLAKSENAPLIPGEKQCKFCRAKGGCAAFAGNVMSEVSIMFSPVKTEEQPSLDIVQQSSDKNPATMDNDQLRQILEAAPLLRQLIDAVEDEAQRRLEAGQKIPGLKLVHGRGSRVWAYDEEEMAKKLVAMGIPKGTIYETKLVTPAKAEKLSWEKRDGTKVQLSKKQLARLDEYITKMTGKLTVAPESDSRPAVEVNVASLFDAVNKEPELPAWLQ